MLVYLHYTTVLIFGVEFATIVVAWAFQGERNLRQVRFFAGALRRGGRALSAARAAPAIRRREARGAGILSTGAVAGCLGPIPSDPLPICSCVWRFVGRPSLQPLGKRRSGWIAAPDGGLRPAADAQLDPSSFHRGLDQCSSRFVQVDLDRYVALCNVAVVVAPAIFYRRLSTRLARLALVGLLVVATQSIYGIPNAYACVCGDRQNLIRGRLGHNQWVGKPPHNSSGSACPQHARSSSTRLWSSRVSRRELLAFASQLSIVFAQHTLSNFARTTFSMQGMEYRGRPAGTRSQRGASAGNRHRLRGFPEQGS